MRESGSAKKDTGVGSGVGEGRLEADGASGASFERLIGFLRF